jgi:hypothetical protein|nr:MAG TPA: hypothetical protein [Caudoviricetes sp.]
MNEQEKKENEKDAVSLVLLHSSEADDVAAIMDLAVYGLTEMTSKHNKSRLENIVLQVLAGRLRKVLEALPKTESLIKTEKSYRCLENIIFKNGSPIIRKNEECKSSIPEIRHAGTSAQTIWKGEAYKLSLEQHVHAAEASKTGAPDQLATAAVEVKFYGEELDLMESAACAANKSLSEFAAEAALKYAEIYLCAFFSAKADVRIKHGLI